MKPNKITSIWLICISIISTIILVACQETPNPLIPSSTEQTRPLDTNSSNTIKSDPETDFFDQPSTPTTENATSENDTPPLAPEDDSIEETESKEKKELLFDPYYQPTISIWEYGYSPSLSGTIKAHHLNEVEMDLSDAMKIDATMDPPANKDLQFSMNGEDIKVTHISSTTSSFYRDQYHRYMGTDQHGEQVLVNFHIETGKITSFNNFPWEAVRNEALGAPLTEKECEQIVRNLLFNVSQLAGEYKMTVKYTLYPSYDTGIYKFNFIRMVDDIETNEQAHVTITDRGRILAYRATRFGCMDGVSLPSNYDENVISKAVEQKLAVIYAPQLESSACSYTIDNRCLTRLQDGKLYLKYEISVQCAEGTENNQKILNDSTFLLVPIS